MIAHNAHDDIVVKLERKRLRSALIADQETGEQDFFSFQARCIRKFGLAAGVFLRQLVFWDGKGADPEGWIYKTRDELLEEIGLSQRQQDKARKTLRGLEVLEEDRRTVAPHHHYCAMHYRVNLEKLIEVMETPHSTLNQWKRGRRYTKDLESGRFDRLPEEVSLGNTESDLQHGNTESDVSLGNSESDVSLGNSVSDVRLGISESDVRLGNSESTTESTSGDNVRRVTSETSSEITSREFLFQRSAGAQNRAAPTPQINKSNQSIEEEDSTTSSPHQPDVDQKMAREVRQLMESGTHAPIALKHYRAGRIKAEEVACFVSQDATGSDKLAESLLPAVRLVLEESVEVAS